MPETKPLKPLEPPKESSGGSAIFTIIVLLIALAALGLSIYSSFFKTTTEAITPEPTCPPNGCDINSNSLTTNNLTANSLTASTGVITSLKSTNAELSNLSVTTINDIQNLKINNLTSNVSTFTEPISQPASALNYSGTIVTIDGKTQLYNINLNPTATSNSIIKINPTVLKRGQQIIINVYSRASSRDAPFFPSLILENTVSTNDIFDVYTGVRYRVKKDENDTGVFPDVVLLTNNIFYQSACYVLYKANNDIQMYRTDGYNQNFKINDLDVNVSTVSVNRERTHVFNSGNTTDKISFGIDYFNDDLYSTFTNNVTLNYYVSKFLWYIQNTINPVMNINFTKSSEGNIDVFRGTSFKVCTLGNNVNVFELELNNSFANTIIKLYGNYINGGRSLMIESGTSIAQSISFQNPQEIVFTCINTANGNGTTPSEIWYHVSIS